MKNNFDKCLKILLKEEGGYVNHPADPGGVTNLGITKRTYEKYIGREVTIQEMKDLTPEKVEPIYRTEYWDKVKGDDLPHGVDLFLFDFGVNAGPSQAAKLLQRLLSIKDDGVIGPLTLQALRSQHNLPFIILGLKTHRLNFLKALKTWPTFGKGWENRVNRITNDALHILQNHG